MGLRAGPGVSWGCGSGRLGGSLPLNWAKRLAIFLLFSPPTHACGGLCCFCRLCRLYCCCRRRHCRLCRCRLLPEALARRSVEPEAELNGKVPLTGSTRDGGVRGRQAPWVVTKEVGKRRRRSRRTLRRRPHHFFASSIGICPDFCASHFRGAFSSDFLRPTGSWQRWDSEQRGTATGRQPLSLVQISSFPPGARVGGPGIAP